MAEFHIKKQQAQIIQQAEVISNDASAVWEATSERLRTLMPGVDQLVSAGQLDVQVGAELNSAISEAAIATEKKSRLRALTKASNIAMGVSILAGISQTIAEIMRLLAQ